MARAGFSPPDAQLWRFASLLKPEPDAEKHFLIAFEEFLEPFRSSLEHTLAPVLKRYTELKFSVKIEAQKTGTLRNAAVLYPSDFDILVVLNAGQGNSVYFNAKEHGLYWHRDAPVLAPQIRQLVSCFQDAVNSYTAAQSTPVVRPMQIQDTKYTFNIANLYPEVSGMSFSIIPALQLNAGNYALLAGDGSFRQSKAESIAKTITHLDGECKGLRDMLKSLYLASKIASLPTLPWDQVLVIVTTEKGFKWWSQSEFIVIFRECLMRFKAAPDLLSHLLLDQAKVPTAIEHVQMLLHLDENTLLTCLLQKARSIIPRAVNDFEAGVGAVQVVPRVETPTVNPFMAMMIDNHPGLYTSLDYECYC